MVDVVIQEYENYGLDKELKTFEQSPEERPLKKNAVKLFIETTKHLSHRAKGLWLKKCDKSRAQRFDTSSALFVINIKSNVEDRKLHKVFSILGEVTGLKSKRVSPECQVAFIYFKNQKRVDAILKQYKSGCLHISK